MITKSKISFCTVSMNRLHHLKQTLFKNIYDNKNYKDIEFVVLDYNSQDNLYDWVCSEGQEYLKQGVLKYYRTLEPKLFDRSHSRNMSFKLATGDIVCNIDADNFTGIGFADYVNQSFQNEENIFLIGDTSTPDTVGRVCVRKTDFIAINGYNERIQGYGFEDIELYARLMMSGKKRIIINQRNFLKAIYHSNSERISNEKLNKGLKKIFILYRTPYESDLMLLYDTTAVKACLINHIVSFIKNNEFTQHSWANSLIFLKEALQEAVGFDENGKTIYNFSSSNGMRKIIYDKHSNKLVCANNGIQFYEVTNENFKDNIILLLSEINNRQIMYSNLNLCVTVNPNGFGKGIVYSWEQLPFKID